MQPDQCWSMFPQCQFQAIIHSTGDLGCKKGMVTIINTKESNEKAGTIYEN